MLLDATCVQFRQSWTPLGAKFNKNWSKTVVHVFVIFWISAGTIFWLTKGPKMEPKTEHTPSGAWGPTIAKTAKI